MNVGNTMERMPLLGSVSDALVDPMRDLFCVVKFATHALVTTARRWGFRTNPCHSPSTVGFFDDDAHLNS